MASTRIQGVTFALTVHAGLSNLFRKQVLFEPVLLIARLFKNADDAHHEGREITIG